MFSVAKRGFSPHFSGSAILSEGSLLHLTVDAFLIISENLLVLGGVCFCAPKGSQWEEIRMLKDVMLFLNSQLDRHLQDEISTLTGQIQCLPEDLA
ncbi:hypothetical protein GUJ93_ZPchr0004g39980 [Zizania palustris]|uniref:Uncharacterized protein n=1 Tax=Zizania palustris TaxID=103762 RepID=A0A8J5VZP3_ZIZPA|nr:hypothetical protein GUJ93_ZPchr0004g39980 [Zizania palustris]